MKCLIIPDGIYYNAMSGNYSINGMDIWYVSKDRIDLKAYIKEIYSLNAKDVNIERLNMCSFHNTTSNDMHKQYPREPYMELEDFITYMFKDEKSIDEFWYHYLNS